MGAGFDSFERLRPLPPFLGRQVLRLAPGVQGITRNAPDGALVIELVVAEVEGAGDIGRYLDSLPRDRTVIVEAVISERLAQALIRRGFEWKDALTFSPETREWCDGFVRHAAE